jgi:hypothetical protein
LTRPLPPGVERLHDAVNSSLDKIQCGEIIKSEAGTARL